MAQNPLKKKAIILHTFGVEAAFRVYGIGLLKESDTLRIGMYGLKLGEVVSSVSIWNMMQYTWLDFR